MTYLKVILSLFGSVFLVWIIGAWSVLSVMLRTHATMGFDPLVMGFTSPWFWALALLFFGLFLMAGRAGNNIFVKVSLFWIPTIALSAVGVPYATLFICALLTTKA